MKPKLGMPWPLMLSGGLLVLSVAAMVLLGQMGRPYFVYAGGVAAGAAVLLGTCLLADVRGSAQWLGQVAQNNASLYAKGSAPDSGVYRIVGAGIAVLGVAIGVVLLLNLPR
ncbi:hypothetical protein DFO47_104370 [Arthrobacter sp. AG258]|uniref:hypothetical protein n=1 Tax=Arthrobacter sp. AG258 TaxID=2183899 RepID=UPI00105F9AA8|nr:hypothetical protein [Arthrobacter sp. AG258]TDT80470.1 hypothetical protein DFO47_104370 [Arthrobacter sp. AG258]